VGAGGALDLREPRFGKINGGAGTDESVRTAVAALSKAPVRIAVDRSPRIDWNASREQAGKCERRRTWGKQPAAHRDSQ
jgi:hypothetical protein